MNRRLKLGHVLIALAAIAALAIVTPALGGPSLKKLVKKEVSKQIAKATGPAGPAGPPGVNGVNGTARAYASVTDAFSDNCVDGCAFRDSKGITSVTSPFAGIYCVTAPGIDTDSTAPIATVNTEGLLHPGEASAAIGSGFNCDQEDNVFEVFTEFRPSINVRNSTDTGSVSVAGNAVESNNVSFNIVIP